MRSQPCNCNQTKALAQTREQAQAETRTVSMLDLPANIVAADDMTKKIWAAQKEADDAEVAARHLVRLY